MFCCKRTIARAAISAPLSLLLAMTSAPWALAQEEPTSNQPDRTEKRSETSDSVQGDDHADDDSPALGVMVGSCPGQGVCVLDTIFGSPAADAGIGAGDYILAVNDQMVSSPKELKQRIDALNAEDTVNVSIWRRGQTMVKQVALAREAKELPGSHRGWLGVMLSARENGAKGVAIREVHRRSPAHRSGLRSGDLIVKLNGEAVESIDGFVNKVQDFQPGENLSLAIRRDGDEQNVDVTLGQVGNAPLQWFRHSFRIPVDDMPANESGFSMPLSPAVGVMDEMIDEMREQIRSLQEQVDELKRPTAPPLDRSLEGTETLKDAQERAPATPADDDLSTLQRLDAHRSPVLAQYDRTRGFRPNISNDWNGSRYGNRGNRDRYRDRYRSYYPPRAYPGYGYGKYPYRYYRYGGRPYYYGGRYPYGFRGGIRIGPNFGIWW